MRHNATKKDKGDPAFNGRMAAKMDFRGIIFGKDISDKELQKELQQTRIYWESFASEFNRLLLEEMIALSNQA